MVKVNKEAYVPLLSYDLGYEETVLQLIKSLDCLDKVVERVYEYVRGNIDKQKSEIIQLNDKLNDVAGKVSRLSNTKKSVQVYSGSKYPATNCHRDYEYGYDFDVRSNIVENIHVAHQICVSRDPSDKLKFYRVDDEQHPKPASRHAVNGYRTKGGLGGLPNNVKHVSSLLLFNSNENLYKNYVISNPYKANVSAGKRVERRVENVNKKPPVFTLPLNDTENQFNYSYTPLYEEVPTIDVPADLPDLPGIADDIRWFKAEEPVVDGTAAVVNDDLPAVDEPDDRTVADDGTRTAVVQETTVDEPAALVPEPEPERAPSTVTDVVVNETVRVEDDGSEGAARIDRGKMYNENINTRSVLMDEIRNAGGLKKAKLRSVNDRKTGDENKAPSGGDGLMADLHKKLAMRRQGISGGNKQNDSSTLEGVIYRMASTMLPPEPESESEPDGNYDTDCDWDD